MSLESRIQELEPTYQELLKVIQNQNETIVHLRKENSELRCKLSTLEQASLPKLKKNSTNSSLPPSQDIYTPKRNQSLRKTSNKSSGGQLGHKGSTLDQVSNPDFIKDHFPPTICSCGCHLDLTQTVLEHK